MAFKFLKKKRKIEKKFKEELPIEGFTENRISIPLVEGLSDEQLLKLNNLLDWNAFVADSKGRRFGNRAWKGKRETPQAIPDYRHEILRDKIALKDKHILEIGCFEGIHTVSLCKLAKKVTAIDSRVDNVVKTMVRCGFFDCHPTVFVSNVEDWEQQLPLLKADLCHHFGVLYHLKEPVKHIKELATIIEEGIYLDTHIARENDITEQHLFENHNYAYWKYQEGESPFAGMYDHAKWLTLESLKAAFKNYGFSDFQLLERREERNGSRILALILR